ncbi:MAG TPA: rhodanese-like domain-containing protein [Atopostipes sp.]|nr:rhodanese-like domain-containing protein [Atopostipes sp.]
MGKTISMKEFNELYEKTDDVNIIDVREDFEFKTGHIPGAKSLPLSKFPTKLEKGETYYVICQGGGRSAMACQHLSRAGYDVWDVTEGMSAWRGELE